MSVENFSYKLKPSDSCTLQLSWGEKLGKIIGTSGAIIGRYERSERTPSVEIARKMALALDVSLDYLVGSTDLKLDSEITKKIVNIQKLPEQERSHLFFVLDNVLQNIRTKVAFAK